MKEKVRLAPRMLTAVCVAALMAGCGGGGKDDDDNGGNPPEANAIVARHLGAWLERQGIGTREGARLAAARRG